MAQSITDWLLSNIKKLEKSLRSMEDSLPPRGGSPGQVLVKLSSRDGHYGWVTLASGGGNSNVYDGGFPGSPVTQTINGGSPNSNITSTLDGGQV